MQKNLEASYDLLEKIGKGAYGSVFKARHKTTKEIVAIKVLDFDYEDEIEEMNNEVSVLSKCNSVNVIKYYGSFKQGKKLWIVMEYMIGSLFQMLKPGVIEETCIAIILREILRGLEHLHKEGKIHRDLKAANILISEKGDIKLADFGVSAQLTEQRNNRNTGVVIKQVSYTCSADIWSLGITAIELAKGKPPHSDIPAVRALLAILKNPAPKLDGQFSPLFQEFVSKCCQTEPDARPTATELLKHPFIKDSKSTSTLVDIVSRYKQWKESGGKISDTEDTEEEEEEAEDEEATIKIETLSNKSQVNIEGIVRPSSLSSIIVPAMSKVSHPDALKSAFDNVEKGNPGVVRDFIQNLLELLKKRSEKMKATVETLGTRRSLRKFKLEDEDVIKFSDLGNESDWKLIGEGGYSKVYTTHYHSSLVTVKKYFGRITYESPEFRKELRSMKKIRHPNILMIIGVCLNPLLLVTEYMENGSLYSILHESKINLNILQKISIALDVAKATAFLHGKEFIHRDIKTANILVGVDYMSAKIGNFRATKRNFGWEMGTISTMTIDMKSCMTIQYSAPEVIDNRNGITVKADVYSFGIVLWEIMTGNFPYGNLQNTYQLMGRILEEDRRPEPMPKDEYGINNLITRCWVKDSTKRPTMNYVVETLQSVIQKIKEAERAERRPKSLIQNEAEKVIAEIQALGDRLLVDLSRNEFKKYFLTNFALHKVLSMYWYGFAMQFEQMDASSIEQIKLESIPPTEKVVRVLSKLYNDFDDISVRDIVDSIKKTLGL